MNPCKWCGMDQQNPILWKCGTKLTPKGSLVQSYACAEIVRLKKLLEATDAPDAKA